MWQMKTATNSLTSRSGALGVMNKGSEKLVSEIPGNVLLWGIQKTALLEKAHILRNVLFIK